MRPPASRWRHPRSAHPGGEVWPCRHAVGPWPHQCAGPAAACGGRGDVAAAVTASLSGRADRELPGEGSWPPHRPAFLAGLPGTLPPTPFQTPPPPFPHLPSSRSSFRALPSPIPGPQSLFRPPRCGPAFGPRNTSLSSASRPFFFASSRRGPFRSSRLSHGTPFTRGTGCPRPPARSSS